MLNLLGKKTKGPGKQLRNVLQDYELPSFPGAVIKVLEVIRDPETSLEEIASVMEKDPGLVVKLLKTVNSAAFGLVTQVVNVGHAVNMMGRPRVEALVVALATRRLLPKEEIPGFESARFWRASARRATLVKPLAQKLHPATEAESFTAALLQDMAIPVLAHSRNDDYGPILTEWHARPEARLDTLEQEAFGWNHAELGRLMAEHWGLPETLVSSIGGHHADTGQDSAEPAVRLVSHIRETDDNPGIEQLVDEAKSNYGLCADEVVALVDAAWIEAEELASLLR